MTLLPDRLFPRVIAEVAQAHDGSLGTAHAFIDAAAAAGADAIKFQTHIAHAESTREEPWRVRFSPQDETRYEYWHRMEFTAEQWQGLKDHASDKELAFLSSPFSIEAFHLLSRVGVAAWKVASGEVGTFSLLDPMIQSGIPVLLSTGMSSLADIDAAVERVKTGGASVGVMQCTSAYPTPPEKVGLNLIPELRSRYGVPIGLSDHSGTVAAGLGAVALGAEIVEVHVTFSKRAFGPDVSSSLTFEELALLCDGVAFLETARNHPVNKDEMARDLSPMRALFTKSVAMLRTRAEGHVLVLDDLGPRKPGGGIPSARIPTLIGRRLARDVIEGTLLSEDDLVPD